jgi:hypothetical protein
MLSGVNFRSITNAAERSNNAQMIWWLYDKNRNQDCAFSEFPQHYTCLPAGRNAAERWY